MTRKNIIRIANAQGFWGDSSLGPIRTVKEGPIDYLTLDYLAEVTMSIMQKQKMRNAQAGYAKDFIDTLGSILPICKEKGIKVIANAAGVNAPACLEAIEIQIKKLGISGMRIGIVGGDNILDSIDTLVEQGETFDNLEFDKPFSQVRDQITSANVYLGAKPLVDALEQGADIVVTGRISDPSLALAPLIYEFGWKMHDYDKLSAGTVLGHLLECGSQSTGGNYTRWRDVPNMANIGYPVAEAKSDGSFVLTKHNNTGGLVNAKTVTSQLLYELADPENYMGPDCIADFTSIHLSEVGENRVALSGITGKAPTPYYKVSMSYQQGYKILTTLCIAGPDAVDKAHAISEILFKRLEMHGFLIPQQDRFLELIGTNVLYQGLVPSNDQPHEIMMRLGAKSDNAKVLNLLSREIAPLLLSGPPGITGYASGRARATEAIGYWPTLINKDKITTSVTVKEV